MIYRKTRNDGIKLWHTTLTRNDGIKLWHTTLCINHGFDSGPKNKLYVIYRNGLNNMSKTNVKEIKSWPNMDYPVKDWFMFDKLTIRKVWKGSNELCIGVIMRLTETLIIASMTNNLSNNLLLVLLVPDICGLGCQI